ncbi:hypothetical protein PQR35_17295 [Paraburkholderia sediminicola]
MARNVAGIERQPPRQKIAVADVERAGDEPRHVDYAGRADQDAVLIDQRDRAVGLEQAVDL